MFNNIQGFSYTLSIGFYSVKRGGGYFKGSLILLTFCDLSAQ
jgi:hypothetical protein